eukprot:jgi/Tetstr1/459982/TSEL_005306.t1
MSTPVVFISSGSSHSAAVLGCNFALTWGCGDDGQLGTGCADGRITPGIVTSLLDKKVSSITCGAEYTVAICEEEEEVYSWGWGDFGRLGHGTPMDLFIPKSIAALKGLKVTMVACGDTHTLAVTQQGAIYSFGRNQNGQLGNGTTQDSLVPVHIQELSGTKIVQAACGAEHSVALSDNGQLHAWGWGRYGNLGNGDFIDCYSPTKVLGMDNVKIVSAACGWRHTMAVLDTGALYTFGWNKYGQLGMGDDEQFQTKPAQVTLLQDKKISVISGGWRHSMAADSDGKLYAWGWGKFGQLGIGNNRDQNAPQLVQALAGEKIDKVACGWRHSLALTAGGKVYAWGRGNNGQLGIGKCLDMALPQYVEALDPAKEKAVYLEAAEEVKDVDLCLGDRYAVVPQGDADDDGVVPDFSVPEPAKKQRVN